MKLTDRNEKRAVQVQNFKNWRSNSKAIWQKLSKAWTDQTVLQSDHDKSVILLLNTTGGHRPPVLWIYLA
ncbi:hypothetical protein A7E78_04865 [Syntrophotalea acetylenivorans]|uniref:Uncharacterized protein n=1 Tax=Syntrophotalea acetylenivorans TaxID=1842532 RepID=A0A1L3GMR2_9BACT|nr:hypothetical protein A7E78_04865 [Syntrophotalea acetylenivorans]